MANEEQLTYAQAGVDYTGMDELKRFAQQAASETAVNLLAQGFREVPESRGEPAYIVDIGDRYVVFQPEGLGSKNLVADTMKAAGDRHYYAAGWDTAATIINDLIPSGARPTIISPHWAAGSSEWFSNEARYKALIQGWADACNEAGAVYGGGETATLTNVIYPETIELSGAGVGFIQPKERLTLGEKLTPGDHIILVESSGAHANGYTLIRSIAERLPAGFQTRLPSGRTFGEAALTKTHIYAALQQAIFEAGVDIHYMVHITGHGWRKLMRANQEFTYRMHAVPPPQEEYDLIRDISGLSPSGMYETFNMGAGFAFMVPGIHARQVLEITEQLGYGSIDAGVVEKGPKKVIIEPIGATYEAETLNIR